MLDASQQAYEYDGMPLCLTDFWKSVTESNQKEIKAELIKPPFPVPVMGKIEYMKAKNK